MHAPYTAHSETVCHTHLTQSVCTPHTFSTHLAASSSSSGSGDACCYCPGAVLSGMDQR